MTFPLFQPPGWARPRPAAGVLAGTVCAALVGGSLVLAAPAHAAAVPAPVVTRISGDDRYATSAAVSHATESKEGSDTVVIASGADFPDGLSASALAGALGSPVLLVPSSGPLPAVTVTEIRSLGANAATIVGGLSAVGQDVADQLSALGLGVARISGKDRYATSAAVAFATVQASARGGGIGEYLGRRTAFLATGTGFADALAASAPAAGSTMPVLLTTPTSLDPSVEIALALGDIQQVVVLGGTGAVSDAVAAEVQALGITVRRIAGADRNETAVQLAIAIEDELEYDDNRFVLTSGTSFPDALSAGPYAGDLGRPILFTEGAATTDLLTQRSDPEEAEHLDVIGGSSVVTPARLTQLVQAATTEDLSAPSLISSTPVDGSDDVPLTISVQGLFDEPLAAGSTVTLTASSSGSPPAPVAGHSSTTGSALLFLPDAPLANGTTYTAHFTAEDAAGNIADEVSTTFTTEPDTTAPAVVVSNPQDGAVGVARSVKPAVTFDEPLSPGLGSRMTLVLPGDPGTEVPGQSGLSADHKTLSYTPTDPLAYGTTYVLLGQATDLAGNRRPVQLSFTTLPDPDQTPPSLQTSDPVANAPGAAVDVHPSAVFDEPLAQTSSASMGVGVEGTSTVSGSTITFVPAQPLAESTTYNISYHAVDLAGNDVTYIRTFTTAGDTTPPSPTTVTPQNGTNVPSSTVIQAVYDEPLADGSTVTLSGTNGSGTTTVAGVVHVDGKTLSFVPEQGLAPEHYEATFSAVDLAGNAADPETTSFNVFLD